MIDLTWEFAQNTVFRKLLQERFVLQHLSPILGITIAKIEAKALKQRAILLKLVRSSWFEPDWLEWAGKLAALLTNHRFWLYQ